MSYNYVKAISTFPNNEVDPSLLKYQIDEDEIVVTVLENIGTDITDCTMTFTSEPSGGEKTQVDVLISEHTTAAIISYQRAVDCSCCRQMMMTTTQRDALTFVEDGVLIYNTTTAALELYTSSTWETLAEVQV